MKTTLIFLLSMLLSINSLKAQEYKMIGNASECSFAFGDGPPSASCNKFLNAGENGTLLFSEVPEGTQSAQWQFIEESYGTGEDEVNFDYIVNRSTGDYLSTQNGIPVCIKSGKDNPGAMWSYTETDVATLRWVFFNKNNEILVLDNGIPGLVNEDQWQTSLNKSENQWTLIFSSDNNTPGDPTNINPPGSIILQAEYQDILDRHNYWRSQLGIAPLVWSDELAAYANDWGDQLSNNGCDFKHRTNGKYGENLFMAMGGNPTGTEVADSWASERKDFDYDTWGSNWMKVGHYTQMIWENTTKVGCAMVKCSNGNIIWVCNYDPPGNYPDQYPYKKK